MNELKNKFENKRSFPSAPRSKEFFLVAVASLKFFNAYKELRKPQKPDFFFFF